MATFTRVLELPVPAETAFRWHEQPGAFARLNPPWDPVVILDHPGHIRDGARVELAVRLGPLRPRLVFRHEGYASGREFTDRMERGPFRVWRHRHLFQEAGAKCRLEDGIEWELPGGGWANRLAAPWLEKKLDRLFRYRHAVTLMDLTAPPVKPMKFLLSGSGGLVGGALGAYLETRGHRVTRLVRRAAERPGEVSWSPEEGLLEPEKLEGHDAVAHLGGSPIARRWTRDVQVDIRRSRVPATRLLAERLAGLKSPPRVLLTASGVNFYGTQRDFAADENSPRGDGFLAEICRDWEAATEAAAKGGIRVCAMRFGAVLSPAGGALAKLLPVFQAGLGGPAGGGRQMMSWIALDDAVRAIEWVAEREAVTGPVNVVAPAPVENREFSRILGQVLGRPSVAPVPALALRAMFGKMAGETILSDLPVEPRKLQEAGFVWQFPELEGALRHMLGK